MAYHFFTLSLILPFSVFAGSSPYSVGEKTSFSITYFGATAGILDLEVNADEKVGSPKATVLMAKTRTDSIFSFFYRFQNIYRSYVNLASGLPIRFTINHDETKFGGTFTQEFNQEKKKVALLDRRMDRKSGLSITKDSTKEISLGTHDVVSFFFHLRSLPLAKGKIFDVPVFIGEESCLLRVEVVEEETIFTKIGDVPSFVLRPSLLNDGQVKEIPETFVWIARNKSRAMVKLKAKVKIGSVVAYLRSYSAGTAAGEL